MSQYKLPNLVPGIFMEVFQAANDSYSTSFYTLVSYYVGTDTHTKCSSKYVNNMFVKTCLI